ncbi:MAG: class I SAM-dependent methyltransferase [Candidatus Omnitrophica bacterium]|nr:class I SAM-dependent methyltransferase [Candidatus Omnitrophota bacterium]
MNNLLKKSYERISKVFLENIKIGENAKVLDIGCGLKGNFIKIPGANYVGIDLNKYMIENNSCKGDGYYMVMDAKHMAFKDNSFDYIISTSFFHHFNDEECVAILRETNRILKKKGKLIVADGVFPSSLFNFFGWAIRIFDRGRYVRSIQGLLKIFNKTFSIIKKDYFADNIFTYGVFVMEKE